MKLKGGAFMNKLDKAEKVLTRADIILCSLTLVVSFIFPFIVNKESFSILFSSGFMYWTVIVSLALSLIAIVLFIVVLIIRAVATKKLITDKNIIIAHTINLIFIASLIIFIYENDLRFIFA